MHVKKTLFAAVIMCITALTSCGDNVGNDTKIQNDIPSVTSTEIEADSEPSVSKETDGYEVTDPFSYEVGKTEILDNSKTIKTVYFYHDGKKIFGQLYLPSDEGDFPIVIVSSGQAASYKIYTDEAKEFADNGIACLIFDYTGSGELYTFTGGAQTSQSDGECTEISVLTEAADLNAILDSLSELPNVDEEKTFLFGHSLGGLSATYTGCSRPDDIKGMMLIEPSYAYPDSSKKLSPDLSKVPDVITDTSLYNVKVGKQFVVDMQSVEIYEMMPKYNKDVIIVLGTKDHCLGADYHDYFDRAEETFPSAQIIDISGADHYFQGEYGKTAMGYFLDFVRSHI